MESLYRTVYDLTPEELDELRAAYYEQLEETDDEVIDGVDSYEEVTDEMIFEHYDGMMFSRDDFFCNMAEESEA